MADEMPEVTQKFTADVEEYVFGVDRAADEARKLALANEEAKVSIDGMRDKLLEAAMALGITRDEAGKLRDAEGGVITATELQARAMAHLRDKALEAAWAQRELNKYQRDSMLSRAGSGISGLLGSGIDALGSGSGLMSLNGIVGILAAVMALGPAIGALTTGLLAAGAGLAAVGLVAVSNFKTAATAASQVQTANDAYSTSLTKIQGQYKYSMSLATTQAQRHKAYATEQLAMNNALLTQQHAINQAYAELSPAQIQLSQAMGALQNQWQSFIQANTGVASKILTQAVGIIGQLLPWLQAFVNAAAPAVGQMLSGLSKFIESPNFQYFMTFLSQLSGPALKAIGSGMEGLTIRVMSLFEMFSKKDVINAINIAFRLLGFTVELVQGLILEGMDAWDLLTAGLHNAAAWFDRVRHAAADFAHNIAAHFDEIRHDVATWAHDIAHWFDDVRHDVANLAHDIAHWFDVARHTIATWADNVVKFFEQLPGRIVHALGNLLNLLVQAGKDIIMGLLHGLQSAAGSVLNFISNLAGQISGAFTGFLGIRSPSRVFMQHGRDTLLGYIAGLQAVAPQVQAAMRAIGGQVAYGGLPGITSGGYGAIGGGGGHLNITVTVAPGAGSLADARWLQGFQQAIQEAVLRYNISNPNNGLAIPGGRL